MLSPDEQKFRRLENEIAELKKENERLREARNISLVGLIDMLKLIKTRVPMSYRNSVDIAELITKLEKERNS